MANVCSAKLCPNAVCVQIRILASNVFKIISLIKDNVKYAASIFLNAPSAILKLNVGNANPASILMMITIVRAAPFCLTA
jgi:hypothetical protein